MSNVELKQMKIHDTTESLRALTKALDTSPGVFYTRFGDGDIYMMTGRQGNNHRWSPQLQRELRESLNIRDEFYMKGLSLEYPAEPGMVEGLFAPHRTTPDLQRRINHVLNTGETEFYSPVLFHYLAVFKPDILRDFLDRYVRPFTKLFIGNCKKENMEKLFGKISHYVQVPRQNAYGSIREWWPKVEDCLDNVEVILPAAGYASRVIQKKLWNLGLPVHSIDFGSIVDAVDGQFTRTWTKLKGPQVKEYFA